jgi:hypothetical protein
MLKRAKTLASPKLSFDQPFGPNTMGEGKLCASILPLFSLLSSPSALASFKAPILLECTLTLLVSMEVLSLLSLLTSQSTLANPSIHHVHRQVWIGTWVEFFEARSTLFSQIQHDTRLSIVLPPSSASVNTSRTPSKSPLYGVLITHANK